MKIVKPILQTYKIKPTNECDINAVGTADSRYQKTCDRKHAAKLSRNAGNKRVKENST